MIPFCPRCQGPVYRDYYGDGVCILCGWRELDAPAPPPDLDYWVQKRAYHPDYFVMRRRKRDDRAGV